MRLRRNHDRTFNLVLATPTRCVAGGEDRSAPDKLLGGPRFTLAPERTTPPEQQDSEDLVLLLEVEDGDDILVAGAAACRVPRSQAGVDLLDRAAGSVAALRRERLRMEKRQRLPDQLIAYFEELNGAETEPQVLFALAKYALRIVGGHTAHSLVRDYEREMLRSHARPDAPRTEYRLALLWDEAFRRPGLVMAPDARAEGRCSVVAPLFSDPQTSLLAIVPVGDDGSEGVLIITERREERIFEPEDWDVLRALTLQAEMALKRVRLLESVRSLSLTDPLTGLANRRHMEVVMEHAWAAARRGDPLTLMVMDLDGFKEVNDRLGHPAGDRLLCEVAEALRIEARGSDVVVRYGGDEFLVILPGGDVPGARALVERVRKRLVGQVGLSAGIVCYAPGFESAEQMIREGDRRLYEAKRRRGAVRDQKPAEIYLPA